MDAKKTKKTLPEMVKKAKKEGADLEAAALKELGKMKSKMESASKKVESYVKKNPEKAMLISAGIAAALAGAAALVASKKGKKKAAKKKK